jgi:hypothetical protein
VRRATANGDGLSASGGAAGSALEVPARENNPLGLFGDDADAV